MKKNVSFILIALSLMLIHISCFDVNDAVPKENGSTRINIIVGKVGSTRAPITMSNLFLTLSAEGEETITDTFSLSGTGQTTINTSYSDMASLKEWTLIVLAVDTDGEIIHSGSTIFTVQPQQVEDVNISLAANYSMLVPNIYPIGDSVTRCEVILDTITVRDSSFAKQSIVGDTIELSYNYMSASEVGVQHTVRLNVYGEMWGIDTLLYTGETIITVISGQDTGYSLLLDWVGPNTPPDGQATISVVLGSIGTVTINAELEEHLPNGKVIYSSNEYGDFDIWEVNLDGSGKRQLTNDSMSEYYPIYSPDGSMVAYTKINSNNRHDVWIMNSDGSNQRRMTNTGANQGATPAWFNNGQSLLYVYGASYTEQIVRAVDIDGTNDRMIFNNNDDKDMYVKMDPTDSNKIVYSYDTGNWAYNRVTRIRNLSTGTDTTIHTGSGFSEFHFDYTSNAQYLLWTASNSAVNQKVEILNMVTGDLITIVENANSTVDAVFSNNDEIFYIVRGDNTADLYHGEINNLNFTQVLTLDGALNTFDVRYLD